MLGKQDSESNCSNIDKEVNGKIAKIERDIRWCQNQLAKNPQSNYWTRRLGQMEIEKDITRMEYDSLLAYIPGQDVQPWIERESAKYGIEQKENIEQTGKTWAISEAIKNTWQVSELQTKKIAAFIIVRGVEFGILILAVLSVQRRNTLKLEKNGKMKSLIKKFGLQTVLDFIDTCRDHYFREERLPNARNLTRKHREIRKELLNGSFNRTDIEQLMGYAD